MKAVGDETAKPWQCTLWKKWVMKGVPYHTAKLPFVQKSLDLALAPPSPNAGSVHGNRHAMLQKRRKAPMNACGYEMK